MKTVFSTQEGVKMNSKLDFGNTKDISTEFQYLMDTLETMFEEEFKYFYRITDDDYMQLAYVYHAAPLEIIAQFKLISKDLKENLTFIVRENIEAHLPYDGSPVFVKSTVFTEQEFNSIIQNIKDEKLAFTEQARTKETPIITYLKAQNLRPNPSGNNPNSWVANCPCGGQHHIMVVTIEDTWGCGYCRRKGKLPELKKWIQELKIKEDQKKLSRMLQELKEHGSIQSQDLSKWWMNRY